MTRLDPLKEYLIAHAADWLTALSILLIGLLLSKLGRRWLSRALDRTRVRDDLLLKRFFLRTISISVLILAVVAALEQLNIGIASMLAGLGITGLILGFALRDTLSNFASGMLLLIYRPFRAGHLIEVEGAQGVVEELTIVNMQMTTTDGVRVILPNSKVWNSKIVNYSLSNRRRLELTLKVREDDVESAISAIRDAVSDDSRVLKTPEPQVQVNSVADNAATLRIWLWTDADAFQQVSADEYLRILKRLHGAELQIL